MKFWDGIYFTAQKSLFKILSNSENNGHIMHNDDINDERVELLPNYFFVYKIQNKYISGPINNLNQIRAGLSVKGHKLRIFQVDY